MTGGPAQERERLLGVLSRWPAPFLVSLLTTPTIPEARLRHAEAESASIPEALLDLLRASRYHTFQLALIPAGDERL
jgi:hypothetical protein